jgi:dihydrofolate reductase
MRKVILYIITTVDGFIADPNGALDYSPTAEEHTFANQLFAAADAILFGRVVYEGFTGYWDTLDLNDPNIPAVEAEFATIFRQKQRVVFSRTLDRVDEQASLIKDKLAAAVMKLKEQPGGYLLLVGGPELVATFVQQGLLDEVLLLICPLVLGQGIALFSDLQDKLRLKLLSTRVFESGTVMHQYQVARD